MSFTGKGHGHGHACQSDEGDNNYVITNLTCYLFLLENRVSRQIAENILRFKKKQYIILLYCWYCINTGSYMNCHVIKLL